MRLTFQMSDKATSRLISRAAFPRCKVIKSLWKKGLVSMASFFAHRRASRRAMSLRYLTASLSHPPNVSTTRGWNEIPWARQSLRWARFLDVFRISMAAAVESAASTLDASKICEIHRKINLKKRTLHNFSSRINGSNLISLFQNVFIQIRFEM